MSHTLAARCTICGQTDDPTCPECRTPSSDHGTVEQRPWFHRADDGYVHEWHSRCIPTTTDTHYFSPSDGAREDGPR